MDLSLCADCGGTQSLPDLTITLALFAYPFVLLVQARGYRRNGGSLLALTLPASLVPLFLGLMGTSLGHARLMAWLDVDAGIRGHRAIAASLAEAQVTLFLGALIGAIVVWLLLMRVAIGERQIPEPSSRWTRAILPAAALLFLIENQQFSWNLVRTLPPNLLIAGRLSLGAAGLALVCALASFVWLWRSTRRGVVGLRVGWASSLTLLAVLLAIAGTSWWWMTTLRRIVVS